MARFEVQGRVSYTGLMKTYGQTRKIKPRQLDPELDFGAISKGKELEQSFLRQIRTGGIPAHLEGVVTDRFKHNKTDVGRVTLRYKEQEYGIKFFIQPDFVFINGSNGNVVDVKLGGPNPAHIVQALMVCRLMELKYRACPNYYLLTNRLAQLHKFDPSDQVTNKAFDGFVISCAVRAGLQVRGEGLGGMFEGNEPAEWEALLGADQAILDLMHDSYMQIGVSVLGLCV